ncbi:uncharacterized protein LOC123261159 [Cotesia glomerata]|uniref:uncharacterized protein LOC123261159 n=1 Tax=Cotesia glomerata TaxID=32391 RepID=UPI001D0049B0|nr:uncharacterized protein LOC123261159 [Cotesia glomerata]
MKTMLALILNPFEELRTEHQCLQHFKDTDTYIPPIEVVVGTKKRYKNIKDEIISTNENITVQVIPLQQVLQKFFELPNIFELTLTYIRNLENEKILYCNVIQGLKWREKKNFGEKIVFPILFYQDDYETNNLLGSRKGLGKLGTVYIIYPCLPPSLRSKVENIFLLSLYKCEDLQYVTLKTMLSRAIIELKSLESTGITIRTSSGQHKIYFSLAGVIGDNLAVYSMLGFCLINRADINSTFDESDCILRTDENYKNDLLKNNPAETGITRPSVLSDIKSSNTIDLLTVDVMHDILEGILEYDLGLILNYFIKEAKFFSLDNFNDRIESLYYGPDEIRNKPRDMKKIR